MFRSVRATPHIEIGRENDPREGLPLHGELLGASAALVNGAHVGFGSLTGTRILQAARNPVAECVWHTR
jgi:hypothetical protein